MADYPPSSYLEHDRETLLALIRAQPLATFIVADGGVPFATPLPMVLRASDTILSAHLDANNPCAHLIQDGAPALAIFHGPSAYISPADYTTRQLPTYNYMQVHVRGSLRRIGADGQLQADLSALVDAMETEGRWRLEPDDARVPPLLPLIVGFHLEIAEISGRFKLSQDKRAADRDAAHAKLERAAGCPVDRPPSST